MLTAEPPYRIEVRDGNRARVGEIDQLISLEMIPRFCDVGTWTLKIPYDSPQAAPLVTDKARIQVYMPGVADPVMAGPVWSRQRLRGEQDAGGGTLVVAGKDDLWWLNRRLARQVPGSAVASQSGSAKDVRGPTDAETVIRGFVDANAGPSALAARQVAGLTLAANGNRGNTVTGTARMSNLLGLLRQLAINGDVGFSIVPSGTNLVFTVYEPADLTLTARFSWELGNLRTVDYTETGPNNNADVVGGAGDGTLRTFAEYLDSPAITAWGRVEDFTDASGASISAELDQAGLEALVESGQSVQLTIGTQDSPDLSYFRDYRLGDRVTVEPFPGVVIADVVREMQIEWDAAAGETKTATVGSFTATGSDVVVAKLRAVQKRIAEAERWR